MKKTVHAGIILLVILMAAVSAQAHVPFIEPEAVVHEDENLKPGDDYTFADPFVIPSGDIYHSRLVQCWMEYKDYDVFKYTVAQGETAQFVAGALTPAMTAYDDVYLATALIGPGLPAPDPDEADDLPFDIPDGLGIITAYQTEQDERMVFVLPEEEFPGADIRWFFPPLEEMIYETVTIPGDYYIVGWNPDKSKCDMSMTIGLGEGNDAFDLFQMDLLVPYISHGLIYHRRYVPVDGPAPFDM